jgi:[protein-PII] uridylyltransferase
VDGLEEDVLATELFHHPDLDSSEMVIATRDVPGLFSLIAGTLAAHGINILSAQIHTRADGIAIDTFQVNDPVGEAVTDEARWRKTLEALRRVLSGQQTVEELLAIRRKARGGAPDTVPGPPKVSVDNQLSDTHTVVEVKCPDRVGLLYAITHTLSTHGLDIASARIATEIEQAYDTFYVTDRQGRRVEDPVAMARLREALEEALLKPL